MNVYLTFDTEIWCGGWDNLDQRFSAAFQRYVYGRSKRGDYALPVTMDILSENFLRGTFFVEPMFSGRFGLDPLREIVSLIKDHDHEVQLHLHPEWADEFRDLALSKLVQTSRKRQHLMQYSRDEQAALISWAKSRLHQAGVTEVSVFRAGSYAVNRDSFFALRENGIHLDTSCNDTFAVSGADIRAKHSFRGPFVEEQVLELPISVFLDGIGSVRHCQIGACGFGEMVQALQSAEELGIKHFVFVSHNFEMLRTGSSRPDDVVVRRFRKLCEFLRENRDRFNVTGLSDIDVDAERSRFAEILAQDAPELPRSGRTASVWRVAEQAWRRLQA